MKSLLPAIRDHLDAELAYLKTVAIVPDLYVIPDEPGFPMVCLLDNGDDNEGKTKGARVERFRVTIGLYQAIAVDPGSSVIGDGSSKGVLEIKDDVMDALRNEIFTGGWQAPFYMRSSRTQALEGRDYEGYAALKTIDLEYIRVVAEVT